MRLQTDDIIRLYKVPVERADDVVGVKRRLVWHETLPGDMVEGLKWA